MTTRPGSPPTDTTPPPEHGAQPASAAEFDVPPERRPRHIAVIMDGNGRWAQQRGLPRLAGHRAGAKAVQAVIETCAELGVQALTLFSFSTENWKRPAEEVDGLMRLYLEYLSKETQELTQHGIRFRQIGRRSGLPDFVLEAVEATERATAHCTSMDLVIALNYGSRDEIVDAMRSIAQDVRFRALDPADIDEALISSRLYTSGLPDPDLLIRTAGERRLSNYLLWQISYAEIYVSPVCWPDFSADHLRDALRDFAARERRFGGLGTASQTRSVHGGE